ncbi:MAG: transglutaminase N-terminal domain-containing protein [Pirellulaceae bacterium]
MKYKVTHTTTYEYTAMVSVSQNIARLTPRPTPLQTCSYHRLQVTPPPQQTGKRTDYFGNSVATFTILQAHRRMAVTAVSKVAVVGRPPSGYEASLPWDRVRDSLAVDHTRAGLDAHQFCFPSPHVPASAALGEYARASFPPGRPLVEAILDLTMRIHSDFKYDPAATTVSTPIDEVFQRRRGVCQDLAHVQIGCLRALGLAARYVSGYLRTYPPPGKPRLVGADASHAWIAVYGGGLGWIDIDPTNNSLPGDEHITIAWGRDYSDVCPISGMFTGGGQHSMVVSVDVEPLNESQYLK